MPYEKKHIIERETSIPGAEALGSRQPLMRNLTVYFTCVAVAFASLFFLSSCDSHDVLDRNIHIGYVLLDDHTCVDTAVYNNVYRGNGRKVVGVVFSESSDDHPALAVMLSETSGVYCDSLMSNGTSGDVTAYDGVSNTVAMANSADGETGLSHCPLAQSMLTFHSGGQSDFIASVAEMRLLSASSGIVNPVIESYGGTPIDVNSDPWYWTSTEVSGNTTVQAWLCSAVNGGIVATPKTESHKCRGIVSLYYPE